MKNKKCKYCENEATHAKFIEGDELPVIYNCDAHDRKASMDMIYSKA